jgi:hypothetical protein
MSRKVCRSIRASLLSVPPLKVPQVLAGTHLKLIAGRSVLSTVAFFKLYPQADNAGDGIARVILN